MASRVEELAVELLGSRHLVMLFSSPCESRTRLARSRVWHPVPIERPWQKASWYEPFDDIDKVALGLRFTLHLPVDAMIPPGHWKLFNMALESAQAGALVPLNGDEQKIIKKIARKSDPLFPLHE